MNPMLFRLRISQTSSPVRRGQILARCSDTPLNLEQKLKTTDEDSLNNAKKALFFYVASVSSQRTKTAGKSHDIYRLAVHPVTWDKTKNNWVVAKTEGSESPHPFDISISSEELYQNFGKISRDTTRHLAQEGFIKSYIREMTKKYRPEVFDDSYDYDKIFNGIANKAMHSSPSPLTQQDKEDVIQSSLIDTITPESLKSFDEEKGDMIKFFSGIFRLKVLSALKTLNNYEKHKKDPKFISDEDSGIGSPDLLDESPSLDMSVEEQVNYIDMVDGFKKFLRGQSVGKGYLIPVFESILLGKKASEIYKELDVSEMYISKIIKKIRIHLLSYAMQSGNDLLYSLAKQMQGPTASESDVNALLDATRQVFVEYHNISTGGDDDEATLDADGADDISLEEDGTVDPMVPDLDSGDEIHSGADEYATEDTSGSYMDMMSLESTEAAEEDTSKLHFGDEPIDSDPAAEVDPVAEEEVQEEADKPATRVPTGEKTKISRKEVPMSISSIKEAAVLDDQKSKEATEAEISEYMSAITAMDELIEDGNRLVGLRVVRE